MSQPLGSHPRVSGRLARRMLAFLLAVGLLGITWASEAPAEDAPAEDAPTEEGAAPAVPAPWTGAWSDDILEEAARVPVQAEGRIKPLHTWAGYALLSANHRRSCKDADGKTVTPLAWWLDAVFRPELAKTHRCFLVDTSEVLDAIGRSELARKKRDRYSYEDLAPDVASRDKIRATALSLHRVQAKERTRVEEGVVTLEHSLQVFEGLTHLVDFARVRLPVGGSPALAEMFGAQEEVRVSTIVAQAPALLAARRRVPVSGAEGDGGVTQPAAQAASDLIRAALQTIGQSIELHLLPPAGSAAEAPEWLTLSDVIGLALTRAELDPANLSALQALEGMSDTLGQEGVFLEHLRSLRAGVAERATARGEYAKIEKEVSYYELDPFGRSQVLYLIAFALIALTWLPMPLRWLERVAWGLLWVTFALHVYGIILRCIIRDRPPITGLYDTVIFISAAAVLSTLVIEHIGRRKVALALTPIVGALGLFIAARYEVLNGTDTMPQLVAVLDTNFWLATHVTCISIGYCAGLVAALIAHVYVLGKLFRFKQGDQAFYRDVGKMVYGTLCFALLFSLVGTILGGIWANDSWGRFWGWDPKENGALLICITQLAILHGRMAGIFKTFGVCQGAILGGIVVAFSWWGVNLLGIGLHSYGFTTGVMRGLLIFYGIEAAVLLAGFVGWLRDRSARAAGSTTAA